MTPWDPWRPLQPFQPDNPFDPAPPGSPENNRKLFPNPEDTTEYTGTRSPTGTTYYQIVGGTITYTSAEGYVGFATLPIRTGFAWQGDSNTVATVEDTGRAAPSLFIRQSGVVVEERFIETKDRVQVVAPFVDINVIIQGTPITPGPSEPIPNTLPFLPDPYFPVPKTEPTPSPSWPPAVPAPLPYTPAPLPASPDPERSPSPWPATPAPAPGDPAPQPRPSPAPQQPGQYRAADPALVEQIKSNNSWVPLITPSPTGPKIEDPEPLAEEQRAENAKQSQTVPVLETPQDARQYGNRTVTSGAPRVDPEAVAQEVGRLEQKMAIMLDNIDKTPDWLDALVGRLIGDLLTALLDALVVDVPATSYEFVAPCDKDADGNPIEWVAEIEAADYQPAMVARLDAIAEALGILKGWRQPTCGGPRYSAPRANVTVTAYEFVSEA